MRRAIRPGVPWQPWAFSRQRRLSSPSSTKCSAQEWTCSRASHSQRSPEVTMQALVGLFVAISLSQAAPTATTGRITGRVTAVGANTPIAGARIMLFPAGRPIGPIGMPPQVTTDQDGRFVFDKLAPGEY